MELLDAVPEVKEKIETGKLNLTTASQVQTFVRKIQKQEKKVMSQAQKRDLIEQVSGKSKREVERIFVSIALELNLPKDSNFVYYLQLNCSKQ